MYCVRQFSGARGFSRAAYGVGCAQSTSDPKKLRDTVHVDNTLYRYHTLALSVILQAPWELGLLICLVSFPSVPLPSFHGALIWQSAALSLRVSHNYQGERARSGEEISAMNGASHPT